MAKKKPSKKQLSEAGSKLASNKTNSKTKSKAGETLGRG